MINIKNVERALSCSDNIMNDHASVEGKFIIKTNSFIGNCTKASLACTPKVVIVFLQTSTHLLCFKLFLLFDVYDT